MAAPPRPPQQLTAAPASRRPCVPVTYRPHSHRALVSEVGKIDPRRAVWLAVDQHAWLFRCVVSDVGAIPHAADHVTDWLPCRRTVPLRQFAPQIVAREKHRPAAKIVVRQEAVVGDKYEYPSARHQRPSQNEA